MFIVFNVREMKYQIFTNVIINFSFHSVIMILMRIQSHAINISHIDLMSRLITKITRRMNVICHADISVTFAIITYFTESKQIVANILYYKLLKYNSCNIVLYTYINSTSYIMF